MLGEPGGVLAALLAMSFVAAVGGTPVGQTTMLGGNGRITSEEAHRLPCRARRGGFEPPTNGLEVRRSVL